MERLITILAVLSVCTGRRVPHRSETASLEVEYPRAVSLDRFEAMLQRANQILRPPAQVVEPTPESYEHLQPQRDHDYNHYMPIYHSEKSHLLDPKSRQMQYMMPPPEMNQATNFYVIKQKKLPKKFMQAAKQLNVKVIADGERGEMPSQARDYGNEHNIIFDGTVYGVDAQAAVPEDVPQEHSQDHGFIAPIYSRRLPKSEDMFATSASKREARMRMGMPMSRYAIVSY